MTGLVLCLALLAAPSNAQKQVLNRLESLQSAIRASASTSQERADALQERLLLRSQAMAGEELDDVTRARWACDQAEDLLSTGLRGGCRRSTAMRNTDQHHVSGARGQGERMLATHHSGSQPAAGRVAGRAKRSAI